MNFGLLGLGVDQKKYGRSRRNRADAKNIKKARSKNISLMDKNGRNVLFSFVGERERKKKLEREREIKKENLLQSHSLK